jgi:ABC-type spermidine/putrescine transport system permease subunit I
VSVAGASAAPQPRRFAMPRIRRLWLAVPACLIALVFFLIPIILMGRVSLTQHVSGGAYVEGSWSYSSYRQILTDSLYLKSFAYTLWVSLVATVVCLAVSYPLAYWISRAGAKLKVLLLFCVIVPLWTNLLTLLYGWLIILSPGGFVSRWLMDIGIRDEPLHIVYNTPAVVIGLVQITAPYAILILTAVMAGIDPFLREASRNLGASRLRTFLSVTLPLTLPGIVSASIVIFVWAMGEYATPILLGSSSQRFVSQNIGEDMFTAFNWSRASALAIALFSLIVVLLVVAQAAGRMLARRREATAP